MITTNKIDEILNKLVNYAYQLGVNENSSLEFSKDNNLRKIKELKKKIENTKNKIKKDILNETFDTF